MHLIPALWRQRQSLRPLVYRACSRKAKVIDKETGVGGWGWEGWGGGMTDTIYSLQILGMGMWLTGSIWDVF